MIKRKVSNLMESCHNTTSPWYGEYVVNTLCLERLIINRTRCRQNVFVFVFNFGQDMEYLQDMEFKWILNCEASSPFFNITNSLTHLASLFCLLLCFLVLVGIIHFIARVAIITVHEVGHDVYRDREDNSAVMLCRDTAQGLEISQLQHDQDLVNEGFKGFLPEVQLDNQ